MKNYFRFHSAQSFLILASVFIVSSCDSRYTPRSQPDSEPPLITVRLSGEQLNKTYRIHGMGITPAPPEITPTLIPGKTYSASIIASDTIALYNLRVGLNDEFFEFSDISATPGVITTSTMGMYTVIDVTLPFSPAKTGTALIFKFNAKPMAEGLLLPFLGMNIIATDFGEAGRSSNVSGYTIPLAYFNE